MPRIFITGSADGLGRLAAGALIGDGHDVVLPARSRERAAALRDLAADAAGVVTGDLSSAAETRDLSGQVNQIGRMDASSEWACMAALRAALHTHVGEPMRQTRTVCPGAVTGTRSSAIQGDGKRLAGTSACTAVRGRPVLRCSGHANHQDPVTPPNLPGGKPGSGPPPGRKISAAD